MFIETPCTNHIDLKWYHEMRNPAKKNIFYSYAYFQNIVSFFTSFFWRGLIYNLLVFVRTLLTISGAWKSGCFSNQIFIARRLKFIQYKYHIEKYNPREIFTIFFFTKSANFYVLQSIQRENRREAPWYLVVVHTLVT